jgi:RNA polymerase sigma-70 factor (ECF subfamily)
LKSIIEQYRNNIRKIISSITGSNNEDIEQEVYIRTWKNIDKYKENGKFKSWISTITANLCRDYMKSAYFKHSQNSVTEEDELIQIKDEKEGIESELIKKQRQKQIMNAIDALKPKFREVIIMYEMQDMSYEEISEKIKCPVGTVRSRLFNARKELSITLKDLI